MRVTLPSEVAEGIRKVVRVFAAEVLDIVVRGNPNAPVIEVFIDNEDGVTIQLCQEISLAILEVLEQSSVPGNYQLTVSSPGVDRPLQYPWQYRKHRGRLILLQLADGEKLKGRIQDVSDEQLTIVVSGTKEERTIPFSAVVSGKIEIEFV